METIIITVIAILFIIGILFSPPSPQKLVVGIIPNTNLFMIRPHKFEPFMENGYFLIEDDILGILVYGQTTEELYSNLYKEIQGLHNAFKVSPTSSEVKINFNNMVREVQMDYVTEADVKAMQFNAPTVLY